MPVKMEEMNNQSRNKRAWILLCASLLAASGCGSSTAETTASAVVTTAAAETTQTTTAETGTYTDLDLLDLDGWWVRPEGYVSIGISLLDYFYVDSDTGTWTGYDDYGQENGMGGDGRRRRSEAAGISPAFPLRMSSSPAGSDRSHSTLPGRLCPAQSE